MPDFNLAELLKELNANPKDALKTLRTITNALKAIVGIPEPFFSLGLNAIPKLPPKLKALLKKRGPAVVGWLEVNVTYLEANPELLPDLVAALTPEAPAPKSVARKR